MLMRGIFYTLIIILAGLTACSDDDMSPAGQMAGTYSGALIRGCGFKLCAQPYTYELTISKESDFSVSVSSQDFNATGILLEPLSTIDSLNRGFRGTHPELQFFVWNEAAGGVEMETVGQSFVFSGKL
jgi:hypothetical protein